MLPLDQLTCETFCPLVGQLFLVPHVELKLAAVKTLGHRSAEALRDPFSLLFCAAQGLRLPQGIYQMKNDSLSEIEIFITQVADGPNGAEFEAIFT